MNLDAEWLEPDGRGGFASGTVGGARSRRYHALLLPATRPPVARMVLVNGLEIWLETARRPFPAVHPALSRQRRRTDVLAPARAGFSRRFPRRSLAALDVPVPRRHARRTRNLRPSGHRPDRARLAVAHPGPRRAGWNCARSFPAATTTRCTTRTTLSLSTPSTAGQRRQRPLAAVSRRARRARLEQRRLPARTRRGIAISFTPRNAPAASTTRKTSPCRACSRATSRATAPPPLLLAADDSAGAASTPPLPAAASAGKLLPALRADEERRREHLRATTSAARATPTSCAAGAGRRSSPVIRGSPTGGATRSSRCAGCVWRRGGSRRRARFFCNGRARCPAGCCPTAFPTAAKPPEYNTVDAALWFVVAAHDYLALAPPPADAAGAGTPRARPDAAARRLRGHPRRATPPGRATASALDPDDGLLFAGEPGGTSR